MPEKIVVIDETSHTGFRIVNRGESVPILNESDKIPSIYLRGKAVYVQTDEPTDMEENDIWIRI